MSDGCDGLRKMAAAYPANDRDSFDEGTSESGGFDPALDEAAGDKDAKRDVRLGWRAVHELLLGAYVPPESTRGGDHMEWRHLELTDKQQQRVDDGLAMCEDY